MANKKKAVQILVCESQEVLYQKALKKMSADQIIVQFAYKIENYQIAAAMFDEVGDYLDAPELAETCRQLAEQTREEQKKSDYQKAMSMKEHGETPEDYEKAQKLFESLGDYQEAPRALRECGEILASMKRKHRRKRLTVLLTLVAIAGIAVASVRLGVPRYALGVCYSSMGRYEKALAQFELAGTFLDSEARAEACRNEALLEQEEDELQILQKAKAGDKVPFGAGKWMVLEDREDVMYLILSEVQQDGAFYRQPYHTVREAVTWEESALCRWLNGEALEEEFEEADRALMLPLGEWKDEGEDSVPEKDRTLLPPDGAEGTEEYMTILSAAEARKYADVLKNLGKTDYWLRDPGNEEGTAAFVSAGGTVIDYGCPVDTILSARPVICIDRTRLTGEGGL